MMDEIEQEIKITGSGDQGATPSPPNLRRLRALGWSNGHFSVGEMKTPAGARGVNAEGGDGSWRTPDSPAEASPTSEISSESAARSHASRSACSTT